MSTRAGGRRGGGLRRGGGPRRSSSTTFIPAFNEPTNGDINLKTTGQGLAEFPGENAFTVLVDPERAQRQSGKASTPKVTRRPPRSVNENDSEDKKQSDVKHQDEERLFLRLKRNLEDSTSVKYSFIRENPNKGSEDYRHNKADANGVNGRRKGKRQRTATGWAPDISNQISPKRTRRSTRPAVYDYELNPDPENESPYRSPTPSKDESEFSPSAKNLNHANSLTKEKEVKETAAHDSKLDSTKGSGTTTKSEEKPKDLVNNDYCNSCGGTGELLCCETCVRSFHFSCIEPPVMSVEEIPEDEWSCRHCQPRPFGVDEKSEISQTFFSSLILSLESHNPVAFQVPTHVREMFAHIQTTKFGEYEDEFMKSDNVAPGPRIQDKNGKTLLCFKCKNSALRGKEMAVCSKCQEPWHIDCVNPPLESTPYGYWVCPLHVGTSAELPLRVKRPSLTSVALTRQIPNNGDIEIEDESDVDPEDDQQKEESSVSNDRIDAGSFSDEEVTSNITFPAQTRMLRDGSLVSKSSRLRARGHETDRVVYKLPARAIKLDFLDAVSSSRQLPYVETPTSDFLLGLDCLATLPQGDSEAVRNLMHLKLQGPAVSTADAKQNLSTLLDAALDDENELGQIAAIRKLMKEKGKQRLLEMLSAAH